MNTTKLDEKALNNFLDFWSWKEGNQSEIAPADDVSLPILRSSPKPEIDSKRAEIRALLERSGGGLPIDAPFVLQKPLCIAALLGRATSEQYEVLCEICDSLRGDQQIRFVAPLSDETPWNSAISIARRVRQLSTNNHSINQFSRSHAVAGACLRLENRGYEISISTFGPAIDSDSLTAICKKIDDGIKSLGGRQVIGAILKWLQVNKRVYQGSLLYGRIVNQFSNPRDPSIPLHYLYNIAWRHYGAVPSSRDLEREFNDIAELARDMAAVFDVEAYSTFDGMNIAPTNFHNSLSDRVVYDELFAFQQWQPMVAARLFSSWIRYLTKQNCILPIGNVDEWIAIGSSIITKSQPTALVVTHPSEHTFPNIDLAKSEAFFGALTTPIEELNKGYLTPLDTSKRNSPYYPLYKISQDLYVLPPRGIIGRAMYERMYTLLREANTPNLENKMGKALELLAAEAISLTGHSPSIVGAEYRLPGQRKKEAPYEVDIADEEEKRVILLECKKKALTNAARAGNSLTTAVDFAQAFLQPLVQMNGHEAQLRSGGVTFLNGQTLHLNGRDIQRIAVTMTDHGSMQDRIFLRAIISALWGTTLTSVDPALQSQADKVNEQLLGLREGVTILAGQAGENLSDFLHSYLHSSWWLGIDQLYFFCERAKDLFSAISPLRSITFGTGDIMTEIAHCDRIGLLKQSWKQ